MKIFAVMTFVAATALAGVPALADSHARGGSGGYGSHAAMLSQDDRAALTEARIAAIRAGLRLTDAQEALFEPVAAALHGMNDMRENMREDMHERRSERRGAMQDMSREERREMRRDRQAMQGRDFMQRLERRSETASAHAAVMADLTQAMRPFWEELDNDQQRLLPILMQPTMAMQGGMRSGMRGYHMRGGDHGNRGGWRYGRGARN